MSNSTFEELDIEINFENLLIEKDLEILQNIKTELTDFILLQINKISLLFFRESNSSKIRKISLYLVEYFDAIADYDLIEEDLNLLISSKYINNIIDKNLLLYEMKGLIIHELVLFVVQSKNIKKDQTSFITGVADMIRLNENFAPKHWKRNTQGMWDDGYETTAYFLKWIQNDGFFEFFKDLFILIQNGLNNEKIERLFITHFSKSPSELWIVYKNEISKEDKVPFPNWNNLDFHSCNFNSNQIEIACLDQSNTTSDIVGRELFKKLVPEPISFLRAILDAVITNIYSEILFFPTYITKISLILASIDGVAHCLGTLGKPTEKEIHVSCKYLESVFNNKKKDYDLLLFEISGFWHMN